VAVKIKLKRLGKIREPYYRIVVADARTKRDGRAIEEIGSYNPKADPSVIEVNSERVQHWLSVGAQPTDPVRHLLTITGDWQKFKGEPGAEGTLKTAEPKAEKKERYESLVKESQAAKETKAAAKPTRSSAKKDQPKKAEPAAAAAPAETKVETKAEPAEAAAPAEPKAEAKAEPAEAAAPAETKAEPKAKAKAEAKAEAAEAAAPAEPEAEAAAPAEAEAASPAPEAAAEAPDGGSGA
jgi:small subunit ribosomal protein S16